MKYLIYWFDSKGHKKCECKYIYMCVYIYTHIYIYMSDIQYTFIYFLSIRVQRDISLWRLSF